MITQSQLKQFLLYEPDTGIFYWIKHRHHVRCGDVAGSVVGTGHRCIRLEKRSYLAHRLAWLYVHGEWPSGHLDHADRNRDNNKISNLRIATRSQNRHNSKNFKNPEGYRGICFNKACRKWQAAIGVRNKKIYLGLFNSAEDAAEAYRAAARKHFGEFAR